MQDVRDRNPESGTEVETKRDAAYCLALNDFIQPEFYSAQDHLSKGDIPYGGLGFPT